MLLLREIKLFLDQNGFISLFLSRPKFLVVFVFSI